jgi:hypothetical protein
LQPLGSRQRLARSPTGFFEFLLGRAQYCRMMI